MKINTIRRLKDARAEARFAFDPVSRERSTLPADPKGRRALERACEIVGEALRILVETDPTIVADIPALPWREAIGLRSRLAHGYDKIDIERLIATVQEEFPGLIAAIDTALGDPS